MAPAMTGPQTAAAEITKITAMRAHDHHSLSADCAAVANLAFLRASARRMFATAFLLGMTLREEVGLSAIDVHPRNGGLRRVRAS